MNERAVRLKVMSFNILDYDNNANGWTSESGPGRRERVIQTIQALGPDIIGLQEDRDNQDKDLYEALKDSYDYYGIGAEDGKTAGRFNSIFYRHGRFTRTDQGTFWLSHEPDVAGSRFPGNPSVRTATWVKLRDKESAQSYFVLNAHWDNGYQSARDGAARLLRERVPELSGGLPVIVTGDLNAGENNPAFLSLLGREDPDGLRLRDSYREIFPEQSGEEGTAHMFEGSATGPRIDYVLHSDFFNAVDAIVDRKTYNGGWASDHFAIMATLEATVTATD